jgi:predicted RNA-binding Zn ribbon-like protein
MTGGHQLYLARRVVAITQIRHPLRKRGERDVRPDDYPQLRSWAMAASFDPDADGAEFPMYGGRVSLDFIATLGRRHTEPVERIPDAAAFSRWLAVAGVLPPRSQTQAATSAQLRHARDLREAMNRLVRAAMAGDPLPPHDLRAVNDAALQPDLAPQLVESDKRRYVAETRATRKMVEAALSTVARDTVHLLSHAKVGRIKECEHPDCSLLFFDESQSGRRRWCSMDRCGNLVKIRDYRARSRMRR